MLPCPAIQSATSPARVAVDEEGRGRATPCASHVFENDETSYAPHARQEYFDGDDIDHSSEPPSAKGLAVFRDPNAVNGTKRTATSINWHPDGPTKIAVSYRCGHGPWLRPRAPSLAVVVAMSQAWAISSCFGPLLAGTASRRADRAHGSVAHPGVSSRASSRPSSRNAAV